MQNQAFENEVLRLTNEFRKENGLKALVLDTNLDETADKHSEDMARQDYFSHTGKDGSRPWDRAREEGYESGTVGENIAAGYSTAKAVVEGWKNSPGHRANMLNANYNEIGIGHFYLENDTGNVNYRHYWTQVFGKGTIENPQPTPEPPAPTPEPPAPTPTPPPSTPTMSNNAVIRGTDKADRLIGGSKNQLIQGKKGNDFIDGKGGSDKLYGNAGNDAMRGGDGGDQMWGGSGNDRMAGQAGNDRMLGQSGDDQMWGGSGSDYMQGDNGNDQMWGGSGNDKILGGSGSDKLVGGDGNDVLRGSWRNEANEKDVMTGGRGRDIFALVNTAGVALYDDGKAGTLGTSNYALITDLNVSEGDMIQLSNDHNYRLGSAPQGVANGQALYIDNPSGQKDELVAVIRGSGNLNLNSSTFQYV